jgi:thiol-disulfide isomerase/thioredoxin
MRVNRSLAPLAVISSLGLLACNDPPPTPPPASTTAPKRSTAKPAAFEVPAVITDGAGYMRSQMSKLDAEAKATGVAKRPLVVVGAPWCEPCVRFHEAVKRGELDSELAGAVLFEFDADRHEVALAAMGCKSKLIPLFAVPDADGTCSARRSEGGIKGEGAVAFMTPKVKALLD